MLFVVACLVATDCGGLLFVVSCLFGSCRALFNVRLCICLLVAVRYSLFAVICWLLSAVFCFPVSWLLLCVCHLLFMLRLWFVVACGCVVLLVDVMCLSLFGVVSLSLLFVWWLLIVVA